MEENTLCIETADPSSLSACELVILHTAEAQEWAQYLQQILKSSRKFRKRSILLYAVSPADRLHGYNFEYFHSCRCIVLLITGAFLDTLSEPGLHEALGTLLQPPHRVVALLCGISEDDVHTETFDDWNSWRKICSEDEPSVYVTTVLEAVTDSRKVEAKHAAHEAATLQQTGITAASPTADPTNKERQEVMSEEPTQTVPRDEEIPSGCGNSSSEEVGASSPVSCCLTVQPSRVLCGEQEKLFIILTQKLDPELIPEVEFSCESEAVKRLQASLENEYTVSVTAPDMPAGVVSLTMCTDHSRVILKPVTYYTAMSEVSRHLESVADPVNFICQAFNLTSNATESLDNLLTDSFKSRMPETGLQMFGIRQIEEDNMAANQRDVELPTLLHFSAKYGLKKLTAVLLQCPGALQAYSVMNKDREYPNTLAERSGFLELRQFIDEFVETADMSPSDVYEAMTSASQDIMNRIMDFSDCSEDIYESMVVIAPECADDLYEVMNVAHENPQDALLRTFFQAKPQDIVSKNKVERSDSREEDRDDDVGQSEEAEEEEEEEEEDPYDLCPEDIYDVVDANSTYNPLILNRPPAPIPRPEAAHKAERPMTFISRDKGTSQESAYKAVRPVSDVPMPVYDHYAGMQTPGQRQLISLQERVKVGEITVDEAVQEFKAWQLDHERRANSVRFQKENLRKLRDSITRRRKERQRPGNANPDYEISAPLPKNLSWSSTRTLESGVYEPVPQMLAPPPPACDPVIQRGSWKTGSTSSTSSTESNRLSTHSVQSFSSGTEPDIEDIMENLPPPPPRPSRSADAPPNIPPPRIPPRIPERMPENERYVSQPTRALPHRPQPHRHTASAPPLPRRPR